MQLNQALHEFLLFCSDLFLNVINLDTLSRNFEGVKKFVLLKRTNLSKYTGYL